MKDILEAYIEGIDHKGRPYTEYEGKKIYIRYGVPGDRVKIKVTSIKKGRMGVEYWGDIIDIIEGSRWRVEPKCKYFGLCGGCSFQNIHYNYILKLDLKNLS